MVVPTCKVSMERVTQVLSFVLLPPLTPRSHTCVLSRRYSRPLQAPGSYACTLDGPFDVPPAVSRTPGGSRCRERAALSPPASSKGAPHS